MSTDTTELEKKSLEAHVDLCAQRYRFLEEKLETMDEKFATLGDVVREVHDMVQKMAEKRNDQLLTWGGGLIAALLGIIGVLISTYVLK